MKFSDKKAVGRLQPITLGGTRIYTSYTGGKPWPGSGSSAAWPNFFRFGQHRRYYSAATAPLPPPLCAANRGILYYFFCNKTSHRQRSPCSKSETIAQNLLRERLVRERESSCYLSWGSGPECCDPYLGPLIPNCSVLCPGVWAPPGWQCMTLTFPSSGLSSTLIQFGNISLLK